MKKRPRGGRFEYILQLDDGICRRHTHSRGVAWLGKDSIYRFDSAITSFHLIQFPPIYHDSPPEHMPATIPQDQAPPRASPSASNPYHRKPLSQPSASPLLTASVLPNNNQTNSSEGVATKNDVTRWSIEYLERGMKILPHDSQRREQNERHDKNHDKPYTGVQQRNRAANERPDAMTSTAQEPSQQKRLEFTLCQISS